jgi:hypothetical protein
MQASTRAELRQFPRRSVGRSQLLTVDVVRETGAAQHGIVLNVSEGGAAVQLLGTPGRNAVSKVRLNFPALETPLETAARLAWVEPDGRAGVRFDNPSQQIRAAIREWLRTQSVMPSEIAPEPVAETSPELEDFGVTLGIIAERAMARTGAKGAAIAIGNRDFMVCCASVGQAPALNAPLRPDSGLSGICLQSGTDLYCLDARTDGRIDAAVAEQLNMRSAALLPVTIEGDIVGILELFSDEPNQFGPATTRDRLGRLLQFLVAAIEEYQPAASTEAPGNSVPESSAPAANKTPTPAQASAVVPAVSPVFTESPVEEPAPDSDFRQLLSLQAPPRSRPPRTVIAVLVLLALAGTAYWYFVVRTQSSTTSPDTEPYQSAAVASDTVPPLVGLSPSSVSAKAGDPFSIDVVLSNAQNISSAGLLITHDPNLIKVVGVSAGDLLGPAGTIVHREQSGQLSVTTSVPSSSAPITGSGILCTIYFLAKSPGTSALSINQLSLKDHSMRPAAAQSSDATVTITR